MASSSSTTTDPWSDLPPELVGLVVARLPEPADIARSRAVCRSWHWAVRLHHGAELPQQLLLPRIVNKMAKATAMVTDPPQQLPRILVSHLGECTAVFTGGGGGGGQQPLPSIPNNAVCLGSTQDWLLLGIYHAAGEDPRRQYPARSYVLHNASSNRQMPLPELDALVPPTANIRKFLMRTSSAAADANPLVVVVITENKKFPFILVLPGKGRWVSKPEATPYMYIIDVAFLGDKLYAITKGDDLIHLHLASDHDGRPVVTVGKRVILQPEGYHSHIIWPSDDDYYYHYDDSSDDDEEDDNDNNDGGSNEEERASEEDKRRQNMERKYKETNLFNTSCQVINRDESAYWHLIESCGKLLMLKRVLHDGTLPLFTCRLDVFEADLDIGAWVPMVNELGRSRALFVSNAYSKSVVAPCGRVKEDTIYLMESGEVFDMKTQTSSFQRFIYDNWGTWLFPPDIVL